MANNKGFEIPLKDFEKRAIRIIKKGRTSDLDNVLEEILGVKEK